MKKIVKSQIGTAIPFADIRDPQLKDYVMKANATISTMAKKIIELQDAVIELQRR